MRIVTAAEIEEALAWPDLIEALRTAFRGGIVTPPRHHHAIPRPDGADATLLLMPAWTDFAAQGHAGTGFVGVKVVSVFPDNAAQSRPSVMGVYLLLSGRTGEPVAAIDGRMLTLWRTAAASALAARYLAREDASRLLVVGAGSLAPYLVRAHASVRPIEEVLIWNRTPERAEALAAKLDGAPEAGGLLNRWRQRGYSVRATTDLEAAVRGAHIVSCATLSSEPLVRGAWLSPGTHVDCVGAFTPRMREVDDDAMRTARVFVDTRAGALAEAGDIVRAIESGAMTEGDIAADLFELTAGEKAGRRFYDQVTVFKSVGASLEDLAAAELLLRRV